MTQTQPGFQSNGVHRIFSKNIKLCSYITLNQTDKCFNVMRSCTLDLIQVPNGPLCVKIMSWSDDEIIFSLKHNKYFIQSFYFSQKWHPNYPKVGLFKTTLFIMYIIYIILYFNVCELSFLLQSTVLSKGHILDLDQLNHKGLVSNNFRVDKKGS